MNSAWLRLGCILCALAGCAPGVDRPFVPQQQLASSESMQIRVDRAVQGLKDEDLQKQAAAIADLNDLGSDATPQLCKALADPEQATLSIIFVLKDLGDRRAIPTLERIVARAPTAQPFAGMNAVGGDDARLQSIFAREAIVTIVDPNVMMWKGAPYGAAPAGSPVHEEWLTYMRAVTAKYDQLVAERIGNRGG